MGSGSARPVVSITTRVKRGSVPGHALQIQLPHAVHQLALHGAADAAGLEQNDIVVQLLHHEVIEPDLAELVDQDRGLLHPGMGEQVVEQRRLATAQETGDQGHRDRSGRVRVRRGGARRHHPPADHAAGAHIAPLREAEPILEPAKRTAPVAGDPVSVADDPGAVASDPGRVWTPTLRSGERCLRTYDRPGSSPHPRCTKGAAGRVPGIMRAKSVSLATMTTPRKVEPQYFADSRLRTRIYRNHPSCLLQDGDLPALNAAGVPNAACFASSLRTVKYACAPRLAFALSKPASPRPRFAIR